MKIILSGEPGIGKSTILEKILIQCATDNKNVRGCIVKEIRNSGIRSGFKLHYLPSHKGTLLACCNRRLSLKYMSRFSVNIDAIEDELIPYIQNMSMDQESDFFIFDEIGRMQNLSPRFLPAIDSLLQVKQPLIATIVHDNEIWSRKYKNNPNFLNFTATKQNRDSLPSLIYEKLFSPSML
ncbi:MAG TPA: hypothetical protein DIC42_03195 [Holosporales bacterium]|nr:hypothetical protein [Holosporales bacterium]